MAHIVYRAANAGQVAENSDTLYKDNPLTNQQIDGNFFGIQNELNTKAPLASPALTGTPSAPTATAGTNTTQLATTAFVNSERAATATLTNKTLTNPTINAGGGVLVLPAAEVPAQTAEGSVVWDSNDDLLTVGTGSARKTIVDTDSTQSLTGKTYNRVTITAPANGSTLTVADGKTFTLSNTLTFSGTDSASVAFGAGGTVAYTGNKLSVFAATTSAELAGVISDETGSGALVFATSPTLTQPTINTDVRVPIVYGSTAASGTLTLASTTNTTKGTVFLGGSGDTVRLNTTTNGVITAGSSNGTFTVDTGTYYKAGGTDVAIADGGTGLSTAPTNGQILIGSGSSYVLGSIASGTGITVTNAAGSITVANAGVTSLTGTANRVSVSAGSGAITLSGPQDLHSAATPSFTQVSLSSAPTATGHAATKSYVDGAIKDGTLTVSTSGTGISGSGTFTANQSTNNTITISSNATNLNTASTIVARDGNGDFSARIITAALSGNASSATQLATSRSINGTSFNGSGDITTANWGTARTVTIGSTSRSVNGSGNVSWTLADIGAQAAGSYLTAESDTLSSVTSRGFQTRLTSGAIGVEGQGTPGLEIVSDSGVGGASAGNAAYMTFHRSGAYAVRFGLDTDNVLKIGGWSAGTAAYTIWHSGNLTNVSQLTNNSGYITSTASITGNAATATTLQTARTINGVSFNGSANITIADSTKLPLGGGTMTGAITFAAGQTWPTFNQNTTGTSANVSGVVAVVNGGTGASDAGTARSNLGAAAAGQTMHIGTTAVAINRSSGALSLNGVNIDGSAGSVAWTNVTGRPTNVSSFTNDSAYITSSANITGNAATATNARFVFNYGTYGGAVQSYIEPEDLHVIYASTAGSAGSASSATTAGSASTFTSTTQNSQFNSIGVGTAASGTAGEIRATNNVTAYYSSDRKFKENINDVQNAVDIVSAIGAKTFRWTDEYINSHGGEDGYFITRNDFGVIAQDVQQAFPMAVRTREDGSLAVNYEKLAVLAFAAIKEQQAQIDELRNLILAR